MGKLKTNYICSNCSFIAVRWLGKCPDCQEWNSITESIGDLKSIPTIGHKLEAQKISEIDEISFYRYQSELNEFDRVLGGGITLGSITLLGGEPGIGKSTLLMELCKGLGNKILYISGEESKSQVAQRSTRMGVSNSDFYILNQTSWQKIIDEIKILKPKFIIIDSIQTMTSLDSSGMAGSTAQIRDVTYELMNYCKSHDITSFIIGHVTKDGSLAGPKVLEHMVDTVIYFEGDANGQYRILRSIKNRFGPSGEVGIFEMNDYGLEEVMNPSQYFIECGYKDSYGRSLTVGQEGSRSLFIEIQSLVVENKLNHSVRNCQGYDQTRLHLLMAVIDKYFKIPLSLYDVYLNITGGIKLSSRDSDLAVIASLMSSHYKRKIDHQIIFLGEVGLTGEVRTVKMMSHRLKEIERLNYKKVIMSFRQAQELKDQFDIELIGIKKACELKEHIFNYK